MIIIAEEVMSHQSHRGSEEREGISERNPE
jgi:hypothetical protein